MQTGIKNIFTLFALEPNSGERGRVTQGLSSQKNDSCDRFVLITQNQVLLLFIREGQKHQCLLTEKVIAIRMVMTRMTARMTTRMRFWMILGDSREKEKNIHTARRRAKLIQGQVG